MLGKMTEVSAHFLRLAEVGEAPVKNDLLIQIQELVGIFSDLCRVMGDQNDRDPLTYIEFF